MITAIVLQKNEEKNIAACLESLSWCDEVLVIDDDSTDASREVAKKSNAVVISHSLENDFSKQRNVALQKAKWEWVLFIDADERVSTQLKEEIQNEIEKPDAKDGYYMSRIDYMWGKQLMHGELQNIKVLRLGKRNKGVWKGKVHEVWDVKGTLGSLKHPILHYPHQTITEFLKEIDFYTTLRAEELYKKKVKTSWLSIVIYTKGKFLYTYLVKRGFLDGTEGLIVSLLMSFHSFMARSKLWFLYRNEK